MTPVDLARLQMLIDELTNALQVVVLVAEHLERTLSATAQDARTITRDLARVKATLDKIRTEGGAR